MINVYSPPGYVHIDEFLKKVGQSKFQKDITISHFRKEKHSTSIQYSKEFVFLDTNDVKAFEGRLQTDQSPVKILLFTIHLAIDVWKGHKILGKNEIIYNYADLGEYIDILKTMHFVRNLLSSGGLKSFVMAHSTYYPIHKEFWHEDENWYRLLADGSLYGDIYATSWLFKLNGPVYFKDDEIHQYLSGRLLGPPQNSLINLDIYDTPWLQVMDAIYHEFGQDRLKKSKKMVVESFIETFIKQKNIDISKADISHLAKFMRSPEQRAGKQHYVKSQGKRSNQS